MNSYCSKVGLKTPHLRVEHSESVDTGLRRLMHIGLKRANGPAFVRRAVRIKLMDLPFDANAPGKTRNRGESARNACYAACYKFPIPSIVQILTKSKSINVANADTTYVFDRKSKLSHRL